MRDCLLGIKDDIVSDCTTAGTGGNEVKAWIGNRKELEPTYDADNPSLVNDLSLIGEVSSGVKLFSITGVKRLLDSGFDRVVSENRPDRFTHFFSFQGFEFTAAKVENLDNLKDLVVIVESKDKTDDGDGVFRIFGLKAGLYPSTDTMRANTDNGVRSLELTTLDGDTEPFSNYTLLDTDYPTTLTLLESLETGL